MVTTDALLPTRRTGSQDGPMPGQTPVAPIATRVRDHPAARDAGRLATPPGLDGGAFVCADVTAARCPAGLAPSAPAASRGARSASGATPGPFSTRIPAEAHVPASTAPAAS